jgi:hypothetical protein
VGTCPFAKALPSNGSDIFVSIAVAAQQRMLFCWFRGRYPATSLKATIWNLIQTKNLLRLWSFGLWYIVVFWPLRCFGGTYYSIFTVEAFRFRNGRVHRQVTRKSNLRARTTAFLTCVYNQSYSWTYTRNSENGGSIFLRNVGNDQIYAVSQPRTRQS